MYKMSKFVNKSLTNMPIEHLIATPLIAAGKAQKLLAQVTIDFIRSIGLQDDGAGGLEAVTVEFSYEDTKTSVDASGNETGDESRTINYKVPLLAIVWVPSLFIQTVDIDFDL